MNRRAFITTITALAGAALAKIKAPAAPVLHLHKARQLGMHTPLLLFKKNAIYVLDKDGYRKWEPTSIQKHLLSNTQP